MNKGEKHLNRLCCRRVFALAAQDELVSLDDRRDHETKTYHARRMERARLDCTQSSVDSYTNI